MQPVNSRRDKALRYAVQWGCCRGDKHSFWQQMWLIMWPSMLSKHCIWWSRTGATPLTHGHSYGTHHANKHAQGKWVHIWWVHCCIRQLHTIVLVQLCFHRPSTKKHTHTHTEHIHLLYPKHSNWFQHLMLCDVWTQCICCSWPNTNHSYTHTVWNVLAVLCLLNIISYQPVGNHFTHVFTNWAVLVKIENVHHKRDDIIW